MPAYFESGFMVKTPAWHKLGMLIDKAPNVEEGIRLAGLDWRAELKELVTIERAQQTFLDWQNDKIDQFSDGLNPIESARAVVRDTDQSVLGVVGSGYTVLQNRDAFNWFNDYIDAGLCTLETAGSLKNGQVVWILAKIQRKNEAVVPNDEITKYFLLSNSHNGSQAVRISTCNVRVVCANTLASALNNRSTSSIRLWHAKQVKQNLEDMKEIIDTVDMQFRATVEQYQWLTTKRISKEDLKKYVKILIGAIDKDGVLPDEKISTRTMNTMFEIIKNMSDEPQQIDGIKGSWYSAYQSYNHYLCHSSGRNEENRLFNIWMGTGVTKNNRALDLAIEMAG